MAYNTDLTPAWANPFWTSRRRAPSGGSAGRSSAAASSGRRRRSTRRRTRSTSAPARRRRRTTRRCARPDPRADSIDRDRPGDRPDEVVAAADGVQRVVVRHLAAADGLHGEDRRKKERIVSVATMEGVWFAYDAATGAPIYQRVKVIDNVEHPDLKPGTPVAVYPSSLGGLNYSPASFDPQTDYVYNAAAETASLDSRPPPTQKKRKSSLGDVFLGLANGDYGLVADGLEGLRLGQRDRRRDRQARLEVQHPEPERGGSPRRQRDRLRRRRRRHPPRLRREDGQGALDVPDGLPDRPRAVGLLGGRHGVRRDRRRRHPDVLDRRHRLASPRCSRSAAPPNNRRRPRFLARQQHICAPAAPPAAKPKMVAAPRPPPRGSGRLRQHRPLRAASWSSRGRRAPRTSRP